MELLLIGLLPIFLSAIFYPFFLWCLSLFFKRPVNQSSDHNSNLSILLPAYNEEKYIFEKLENIKKEINNTNIKNFEIIVTNDCSTDRTKEIIQEWKNKHSDIDVNFIDNPCNQGKWISLKKMIEISKYEILLITDISSLLPEKSLEACLNPFQDSRVKVVSPAYAYSKGELTWQKYYWKYSKMIRSLESNIWTTCGSHGSGYLIRKSNLRDLSQIEKNQNLIINDDFILPMLACQNGGRNIYQPYIEFTEIENHQSSAEYQRRDRMAVGNLAMSFYLFSRLSFSKDFFLKLFFIFHKGLRSVAFIFLFICLLFNIFIHRGESLGIFSLILILSLLVFPPSLASFKALITTISKRKVSW